VLVYYYAWWGPDAVGEGKSPDWPPNPYHSWDTGVLSAHVAQIASAGIDGMVVAWYGPTEANNQTETNFRYILDQASANGTTALLSVDLGYADWFKNTQEVIDGLRYALDVHAKHPAYFRYNGKPVLFFWYQQRYSLEDWSAIRAQVDPDRNSIWIAEGIAPDAVGVFDGLHLYTISWSENPYSTAAQWANTTRSRGGIWVATAMPGWDNTYTQQSERYIRERGDGAFLRETFGAGASTSPNMIVITSWNEWWEGTHIEPSVKYGDFYLNLTRQVIAEYKSSGAVASGGAAPPVSTAVPTPVRTAAPTSAVTPGTSSGAASQASPFTPNPPTFTPTSTYTATPPSIPTLPVTALAESFPTATAIPAASEPETIPLPTGANLIFVMGGALVGLLGLGLIAGAGWMLLRSRG
jgi:hypothetical protein